MQIFQSLYDLDTDHNGSFKVEFLVALLKQLLQTRTQQVHDHDMMSIKISVEIKPWESH